MKVLVIDCHYLCYRSLYSTGKLTHDSKGTGVIFGFLTSILELAHQFQTNRMVFCWDSPHSYRSEIYPPYKSSRSKRTPTEQALIDDGKIQFNKIRETVLPRMGFANIYIEHGLESDDLMASIALNKKFEEQCVIVTSDEDLFQCIRGKDVVWYNPKKRLKMDENAFFNMYQISPIEWGMVKRIAGCSTDDVGGVQGVGNKTAIKYIRGELTSGKKFDEIVSSKKILRRNYDLVVLPFKGTPVISTYKKDMFSLVEMMLVFQEHGFTSFIEKMTDWDNFIEGKFPVNVHALIRSKLNKKKGLIE